MKIDITCFYKKKKRKKFNLTIESLKISKTMVGEIPQNKERVSYLYNNTNSSKSPLY